MKALTTTVLSTKKFSENDILIKLSLSERFDFKAGQFIMAHAGKEESPFSIASPPSQKTLELLIKVHEGGKVTPTLYKLKKGDRLKITGPYGTFGVKETGKGIYLA